MTFDKGGMFSFYLKCAMDPAAEQILQGPSASPQDAPVCDRLTDIGGLMRKHL